MSHPELDQVAGRLAAMEEQLSQARRDLAAAVARKECADRPAPVPAPASAGVEQKLEQILRRLELLPVGPAPAAEPAHDPALKSLLQRVADDVRTLREQRPEPAPVALPVRERRETAVSHAVPGGSDAWLAALLGDELARLPGLSAQREAFQAGVLAGDPSARAFAGQMLIFAAAGPDKMSPALKDLGEAYYRWNPKRRGGASPLEKALAAWAQRRCEAAGVPNSIELVEPGQRFDAARHHTTGRGVEIEAVCGWVVLRDNGRVYTKASVEVK